MVVVASVALVVTGCDGASDRVAKTAVERALAWCDESCVEAPSALVLASLQRAYALKLNRDPRATFVKSAAGRAPFRRVYDGSLRLAREQLPSMSPTDQRTLLALYCDTTPPPPSYRNDLMNAVEQGGYRATHVLLAAIYLRSNGCTNILSATDRETIHARIAALIRLDDGTLDDLDVEAMTFLAADGRADLVPTTARDALIASQRADGSWQSHTRLGAPLGAAAGSQHTTVLALWFLLHERAGGAFVSMSPPAS
jgi:hypothetical protein